MKIGASSKDFPEIDVALTKARPDRDGHAFPSVPPYLSHAPPGTPGYIPAAPRTQATNHDRVTPKEKHVTTLKQAVEFGIHRQGNVLEYTLRWAPRRSGEGRMIDPCAACQTGCSPWHAQAAV